MLSIASLTPPSICRSARAPCSKRSTSSILQLYRIQAEHIVPYQVTNLASFSPVSAILSRSRVATTRSNTRKPQRVSYCRGIGGRTVSLLDTRNHHINRLIVRYMGDADYCGMINFRVLERRSKCHRHRHVFNATAPPMTLLFITLSVRYWYCLCPFVYEYDVWIIWGSVLTEHTSAYASGSKTLGHAMPLLLTAELTVDNAAQLNKISSMNYSGAVINY